MSTLQVLGQYLKTYDLEVMMAVSLPHEHEDDNYLDPGDLEEICSSHGFEYVEGTIDSVPGLSSCSREPASGPNTLDNWHRRRD